MELSMHCLLKSNGTKNIFLKQYPKASFVHVCGVVWYVRTYRFACVHGYVHQGATAVYTVKVLCTHPQTEPEFFSWQQWSSCPWCVQRFSWDWSPAFGETELSPPSNSRAKPPEIGQVQSPPGALEKKEMIMKLIIVLAKCSHRYCEVRCVPRNAMYSMKCAVFRGADILEKSPVTTW